MKIHTKTTICGQKVLRKVLEKSQENRSLAENDKIENENYEEKGKRR